MDILETRSVIVDGIRGFLKQRGYLEVETPIVTLHPGMEPHLDYFQTAYVSKDGRTKVPMFLNHSPELEMKKLLGRGYEKVFQMVKVFRNGEAVADQTQIINARSNADQLYRLHHSEFTMLEWYRSGEDYTFMMDETEELCRGLCRIDGLDERMCLLMDGEWERISVREVFVEYAGVDLEKCREISNFQFSIFNQFSIGKVQKEVMEGWGWDELFFWVMLNKVEPNLGKEKPTILYDYPVSQAALAKRKCDLCFNGASAQRNPKSCPHQYPAPTFGTPLSSATCPPGVGRCAAERSARHFWAERFEVYIDGVELCNAFSELCDPVEQRQRLVVEQEERRQMGKVVPQIDEKFLTALGKIGAATSSAGSGSATGNALGVDRLVMLLLRKRDVRDVMVVSS